MSCQVCGNSTLNYFCEKCGAYIIDTGGLVSKEEVQDEAKEKAEDIADDRIIG